jgi:hypothetical protein
VYSFPNVNESIRQGDIFRWLPKLELVTGENSIPLLNEQLDRGIREVDWFQTAQLGKPVIANVLAISVIGIVISQDCDASRAPSIAFCEVRPFCEVYPQFDETTTKLNGFVNIVVEHSRKNQKWYYMAENPQIGFNRKMGVDFHSVFMVPREFLDKYKETLRLGRLDDDVAYPHFRERVSEFFRRYPYNEWYPLNSAELAEYEKKTPVDIRYPWQIR